MKSRNKSHRTAGEDPQKLNAHAFTLTEILVVVAVIAVLAALILPGLAGAKTKASSIVCFSNQKTMGAAFELFAGTRDEFPLFLNPKKANPDHERFWMGSLTKTGVLPDGLADNPGSAASKSPWNCPNAKQPNAWPNNQDFMSYGYNAYGTGDSKNPLGAGGIRQDSDQLTPVKRSGLSSPSDFILHGDSLVGTDYGIAEGTGLLSKYLNFPQSDVRATNAFGRHAGKANIGFADGHVSPADLKQLFLETNNIPRLTWNR